MSPESNRVRSAALWPKLMLSVGALVFALAVAELGLRIVAPPNPFNSAFPLYPHRTRYLQVTSYGHVRQVEQHTNRWGLRGEEPPAEWDRCDTIVAVGGSTTQCYYIDDHKTWTYQLQRRLAQKEPCVWVGNAGMDGHSTRAHLLVMRDVVAKILPKRVIFLVGANDLGLSLSMDGAKGFDKSGDWKWRLVQKSRLAQMISRWLMIKSGKAHRVTNMKWEYHPVPLTDPAPLPADLRQLLPQLPEFKKNVEALIAESRRLRIEPLFLTQPMLWDDSPRWHGIEGGFYWVRRAGGHLSAATYWKLQNLYNETLLETCREQKASCFDLASVVPHRDLYFDDFVHFSEAGCEFIAQKLAEFMEKHDAAH